MEKREKEEKGERGKGDWSGNKKEKGIEATRNGREGR